MLVGQNGVSLPVCSTNQLSPTQLKTPGEILESQTLCGVVFFRKRLGFSWVIIVETC